MNSAPSIPSPGIALPIFCLYLFLFCRWIHTADSLLDVAITLLQFPGTLRLRAALSPDWWQFDHFDPHYYQRLSRLFSLLHELGTYVEAQMAFYQMQELNLLNLYAQQTPQTRPSHDPPPRFVSFASTANPSEASTYDSLSSHTSHLAHDPRAFSMLGDANAVDGEENTLHASSILNMVLNGISFDVTQGLEGATQSSPVHEFPVDMSQFVSEPPNEGTNTGGDLQTSRTSFQPLGQDQPRISLGRYVIRLFFLHPTL